MAGYFVGAASLASAIRRVRQDVQENADARRSLRLAGAMRVGLGIPGDYTQRDGLLR